MKSFYVTALAVVAIVAFMWCSTPLPARAADEQISFKADSVTVLKDKNGAEYVRMIWSKPGELNGVKYSKQVSVNAYREHVAAAKAFKAGDQITAVASRRTYQGAEYYTILGFQQTASVKKN